MSETDNHNIIKEALEAGLELGDLYQRWQYEDDHAPKHVADKLREEIERKEAKINAALALIEKSEVMNITQIISSGGYSKVTLDNAERSDDERIGMAVVIPLEQE